MKNFKFGSRVLAFVLAFIMVLSLIPASVLAATINDISTGTAAGQTGIVEDTLGDENTINWPIKIYDYLEDGMLFEYSSANGTAVYDESYSQIGGGLYGGGEPMPVTTLGSDYTGDWVYSAYTNNATENVSNFFTKTPKAAVANSTPKYMRLTRSATTTNIQYNYCVCDFYKDWGTKPASDVRYMVIAYRANGISASGSTPAFELNTNIGSIGAWNRGTVNQFKNSTEWTYMVIDLKEALNAYNGSNFWDNIGSNIYRIFIRVNLDGSDYFDLSHVAFFKNAAEAERYGKAAVAFDKNPGTRLTNNTTTKYSSYGWNAGNNLGFGLLLPSSGGKWALGGGNPTSTMTNGYRSYRIGYNPYPYGDGTYSDVFNTARIDRNGKTIGADNKIYFLSSTFQTQDAYKNKYPNDSVAGFNMADLNLDGYKLFSRATEGLMTVGLLEGELQNGLPVYREETVTYIAEMLEKTLVIPQKDSSGKYNYNFVKGQESSQFGTVNGKNLDLAQALRNCLGITFTSGQNKGSAPTFGSFSETQSKGANLKGKFLDVKGNIKTCMDAAYFLLNNIFVDNSYNQLQSSYRYLTLSSATMDNGKQAYVFDAGFSNGAVNDNIGSSGKLTQEQYKAQSKSAVEYNDADRRISLGPVQEKDMFYYNANNTTTRFPFLPINNKATGDYAGATKSYYFMEDGYRSYTSDGGTYVDRNFDYVLSSNGEFVYNEEDDLFFEFEGDDDVYLFINNQIVLDIGGAHSISKVNFKVNDYVNWAREVMANPSAYTAAEQKRAKALDLTDGELVKFDFFYMERHGYGANMRIVTNMHVTDPELRVEKSAYQFGEKVDAGGIINPAIPLEYNFKIKNTGNTKLYNLTFDDSDIGVSLTPANGLEITSEHSRHITDARGETLDANDLTAVVTGYMPDSVKGDFVKDPATGEYNKVDAGTGTHVYIELTIHFNNNNDLKVFLKTLEGDGLDDETVNDELSQSGSGLWVDADVTIKGIYYTLTDDQADAGAFDNTVNVTATTKTDTNMTGNETLRSAASHRVYAAGIPYYYQWAGHNLFVPEQQILDDATKASASSGNKLSEYAGFFTAVNNDTSKIWTTFCDKYGKSKNYSPDVESFTQQPTGDWGMKINYTKTGINEFYLLMRLQSADDHYNGSISNLTTSEYAIIRVMIYTTDTQDAKYVLDYGLKTESLDTNGELFKNDNLLGAHSGTISKLMGVSTTGASYLDPANSISEFNRIDFDKLPLDEKNKIDVRGDDGSVDGHYTLNMNVPDNGKVIAYNSESGKYSLTDVGTVSIHVSVPEDWQEAYLYYWYDGGADNGWPGTKMNTDKVGHFSLSIPGDVPHVIISNGTLQTINIDINPGEEAWITIDGSKNAEGKLIANADYHTSDGIVHAKVPDGWGEVYLYYWDAYNNNNSWPGEKLQADANGFYTMNIPGNVSKVIINNGKDNGKQTEDVPVFAGKETWITVHNNNPSYSQETNIHYYKSTSSLSTETVTIHATVPDTWNEARLYYWNSNGSGTGVIWPGIAMTKGADGVYTLEGIPADVTNIVINDGNGQQTADLLITPGLETWFDVTIHESTTAVEATVPANYGDVYFYFFDKNGDVGSAWPGTKVEDTDGDGIYSMKAPAAATKVIVNNDNGTQTQNLLLTPEKTNIYTILENGVATTATNTKLYISVPEDWGEVAVHHWNDSSSTTWPGDVVSTKDSEGRYVFEMAGNRTGFIVNNNNNGKQTGNIDEFCLGDENYIDIRSTSEYYISSTTPASTGYSVNTTYGEDAEKAGFTFTPTDFMDSVYDIWMAIAVHETDVEPTPLNQPINFSKEVQMYKKVSVMPANVVYYEDDFAGIKYDTTGTANSMTHVGSGSGSLSQSIDQNLQYGNDSAYQNPINPDYSGESQTQVSIGDTKAFATFDFTGTGFEIIGRTNAVDSSTARVVVKDQSGKVVKTVIVVTEYDNNADEGDDAINQFPIVRVNGLTFGKYTVEISGVPVYDFSNFIGGKPGIKESWLIIDGIRIYQSLAGSIDSVVESDTRVVYTGTQYPVYYQWDTQTPLYLSETQILEDAAIGASQSGTYLSRHKGFFDRVGNDTNKIYSATNYTPDLVSQTVKLNYEGNGLKFDCKTPGIYTEYMLMCLYDKAEELKAQGLAQFDLSYYADDEYAIIPITFIVADDGALNTSTYNLALGANYEANKNNDHDQYKANLTDGVAYNTFTYGASDEWFGFIREEKANGKSHNTNEQGEGVVTVDLGVKSEIKEFSANTLSQIDSGVTTPEFVEVYVSDDNENFISAGQLTATTTNNAAVTFKLTKIAQGRYVRFVFGKPTENRSWVMVNEIEVMGTPLYEETANVALNKDYTVEGYGDWDVANLTDGVKATAIDRNNKDSEGNYRDWFGFHKDYNSSAGYGDVLLDLGNNYDMSLFKMHLCDDDSDLSIGVPSRISVEVSKDATNFEHIGDMTYYNAPEYASWASLAKDAEGRYIRFRLYNSEGGFSWNFLNEIEVYGKVKPELIPGLNDNYPDTENAVTFTEIRNLIADRQVFAIKYDDSDGLSVSGGTNTWIENRNNALPSDQSKWTNNTVNSVNDYLISGPNNEVYMKEVSSNTKSALALYVQEIGVNETHTIQIAARAIDYGQFSATAATGLNAELQYGAYENGEYVWKPLAKLTTGTEQYYTIPYADCPYDADNNRYQVVIRVADTDITGMASFTSLKYKGLTLCTLNETEVPDVIYDEGMSNTVIDSTGNTYETSKFVGFVQLVEQMQAVTVSTGENNWDDEPITPPEPTVTGTDTSSLGVIADSFTANGKNFVLTENSKFYIVTSSEATKPSDDVIKTVQLVQKQFAADSLPTSTPMEIVWGLEKYASYGDIIIYADSSYSYGDEEYKLVVENDARIYVKDTNALLYGLNTLQKHFRKANTNAIKGFTTQDKPDTKERTVHLDIARKYLTKDWIINYIREMSWMGYNSLELHLAEDGGFRTDFWDDTYYPAADGNTGNDFSWAIGSMLQPWCYSCPDPDSGKYLTAAEMVQICEVAKEYHIDIIPSFDTPAHVGWMTKHYDDLVKSGNTSIKNFKYNGTTYTLPDRINYRSTGTYDYAVLDLSNANVQKFALAMYTDIAAFFREYAGSTKFNICGDEVGLNSSDRWDYADFVDYVNSVNSKLNSMNYTVRIYNDFLDRSKYINAADRTVPNLASNIEIVYWDAPTAGTLSSDIQRSDYWVNQGRVMHSGVQNWTYYVLRIFNDPNYTSNSIWGMDARHPNNTWWSFSHNTEERVYNEWNPTRFSEYNQEYTHYYSGDLLASGYFMVWCDYAGLNTEVEMWNGVNDNTTYASTSGGTYSLINRMWSNAIKQWNWDINSSLSFANYKAVRDAMGFFPGYVETASGQRYAKASVLPESTQVNDTAYRPYCTVTFKNWDGTVLETQQVRLGSDATAPAEPTRPNDDIYKYTFIGWDKPITNITGNRTLTAQYQESAILPGTTGYLELKVSGGTNILMSVDGGAARPLGKNYIHPAVRFGQEVKVTAETTNDNLFMGWINGITGEILTTERTYTFYSTGNDVLIAMYKAEANGANIVTFKNDKSNKIVDIQYYAPDSEIKFPESTSFVGYEFVGWNHSVDQIRQKLANGEDVTVLPVWTAKDVYVSINVNGGDIVKSGKINTDGKYLAYKSTTVSADTAPDGKMFSHWEDENGNILSYAKDYTFYPYKDTKLTAMYVSDRSLKVELAGYKSVALPETNQVYIQVLEPEWKDALENRNGVYAAYIYNDGETLYDWLEFTHISGDIYYIEFSTDYKHLQLACMNSARKSEWNIKDTTGDIVLCKYGTSFTTSPDDEDNTVVLENNGYAISSVYKNYFVNNGGFEKVEAYYTEGGVSYKTKVELIGKDNNGYDEYSVEIPKAATDIMFTDGNKEYTYSFSNGPKNHAIFNMVPIPATLDYEVVVNADIDTTSLGDSNTVFFSWSVPEKSDFTFVNAGVLFSSDTNFSEETFLAGTLDTNVTHFVPTKKYQTATGSYSVTKTGISDGDEMIARAFVMYRDSDGILRVAYSDIVYAQK